jgi:hypothetical protein
MPLILITLPEFNLAQAVGFLSFFLGILCFYQKDDTRLKVTMVLMCVSHAVHYAMMAATTACIGATLAIVRTGLSIKTSSATVAYVFMLITLVFGLLVKNSWADMLPIAGSIIGTYAIFMLQGIKMRVAFLIGAGCWLINNLLIGSIGLSLLEAVLIGVNITTIYRLTREESKKTTIVN